MKPDMNKKKKYPRHVILFFFGVVIVCLVGILFVRMEKERVNNAKIEVAKTQIIGIKEGLDGFKRDNGFYPDTEDGLEALVIVKGVKNGKPYPENGYFKKIPPDPWGTKYQYKKLENNLHYDIWSSGPDRKSGTKDDVRPSFIGNHDNLR